MAITETERSLLTRKQAAEYISRKHMPISPATLARYAMDGNGPHYCYMGGDFGRALYEPGDLDAWIKSFPKITNAGLPRKNRNVGRASV